MDFLALRRNTEGREEISSAAVHVDLIEFRAPQLRIELDASGEGLYVSSPAPLTVIQQSPGRVCLRPDPDRGEDS